MGNFPQTTSGAVDFDATLSSPTAIISALATMGHVQVVIRVLILHFHATVVGVSVLYVVAVLLESISALGRLTTV